MGAKIFSICTLRSCSQNRDSRCIFDLFSFKNRHTFSLAQSVLLKLVMFLPGRLPKTALREPVRKLLSKMQRASITNIIVLHAALLVHFGYVPLRKPSFFRSRHRRHSLSTNECSRDCAFGGVQNVTSFHLKNHFPSRCNIVFNHFGACFSKTMRLSPQIRS